MDGAVAVFPLRTGRAQRPRPLIVALTGGLACGKSTTAALFRGQGAPVLDADRVCHALLADDPEVRVALRRRFGAALLDSGGRVRRAELRVCLLAGGSRELDWLEGLLHWRVYRRLEDAWLALPAAVPYCLWVVPLLLESGALSRVNRVLVVDCPPGIQRRRVVRRAGEEANLDEQWLDFLLRRQCGRAERLAVAHDLIDNSGPERALRPQVRRLHRRYRGLAMGQPAFSTG